MPEKMERALKAQAKKKGFSKERTAAFVYGLLVIGNQVTKRKDDKRRTN